MATENVKAGAGIDIQRFGRLGFFVRAFQFLPFDRSKQQSLLCLNAYVTIQHFFMKKRRNLNYLL